MGSFERIDWSYDGRVFNATIGEATARFMVAGNLTSIQTITATAIFSVAMTTCMTS
jgi:hypothetical protein